MTEPTDILTAEGLHKHYGTGKARNHVLRGLDLSVRAGEFLAIMGPSGCGKSTLLHLLGLMTRPNEGRIGIGGRLAAAGANTVPERLRTELRRREIGFVFQRFNLLGVLSAEDNVRISLRVRGLRDMTRAEELFEAMHVGHVRRRKPGRMSIGEQQRVAVVRALAHRPSLLLADEPTGNLDSANGETLLAMFREINRAHGQTIVMITHSHQDAEQADRILYMHDGRIQDAV
jgi:putative ABC transport system ATP-binding protein